MMRIRNIKAEFYRHTLLARLEHETGLPVRISFAGLWGVADREARFRWLPEVLKLDILPFDRLNFEDILNALWSNDLIRKYQVGSDCYGLIPKFHVHQRINQREAQSALPAPTDKDFIAPPKYAPPAKHVLLARACTCFACGAYDNLQFDRIVPFSKGGTKDLNNLQIVCRGCASQGNLSTDMHVRAHGEREGERAGDRVRDGVAPTTPAFQLELQDPAPGKGKGRGKGRGAAGEGKDPVDTSATWSAYSEAYKLRWRKEPIRNKKVNSQMAEFVRRIPAGDAPEVARFYLTHNKRYYVDRLHPVGALLQDAEALHTQWFTNRQVTSTDARRADQRQGTVNAGNAAAAHFLNGGRP